MTACLEPITFFLLFFPLMLWVKFQHMTTTSSPLHYFTTSLFVLLVTIGSINSLPTPSSRLNRMLEQCTLVRCNGGVGLSILPSLHCPFLVLLTKAKVVIITTTTLFTRLPTALTRSTTNMSTPMKHHRAHHHQHNGEHQPLHSEISTTKHRHKSLLTVNALHFPLNHLHSPRRRLHQYCHKHHHQWTLQSCQYQGTTTTINLPSSSDKDDLI